MKEVFYSDFGLRDMRWQTRVTPNPDLPAGKLAPQYMEENKLKLRLQQIDNQVYTSHIATTQTFLYGHFEARMKFSSPIGAHSSFWLQDPIPDNIGGSEVDIVEHFGKSTLWHNVYWRDENTMWPRSPNGRKISTKTVHPKTWHVYGLDWRPDKYVFTIDGTEVGRTTDGLSNSPKNMILSLLSNEWEWPDLNRDELWRYKTMVDWVRVSQ